MRKRQTGKRYMVLKIDLEKAYDKLSWGFIWDTLEEVGFEESWIRNILTCVGTSRMAAFMEW